MIIQHNMMAMNANNSIKMENKKLAANTEKLSSGFRINRSADDAAGLSISEKMRTQIRGLNRASLNAQDGISMIQVAEGALNEVHSILQRMNELAVQGANDTNVTADRDCIKKEITQLAIEIDEISNRTEFNGMKLLDSTVKDKKLQVGANSEQSIDVTFKPMDTHALGLRFTVGGEIPDWVNYKPSIYNIGLNDDDTINAYGSSNTWISNGERATEYSLISDEGKLNVDNYENAGAVIKLTQNAIEIVSQMRSVYGATQNRLEHAINYLQNSSENLQSSESKIRDTDMANEMVEYSKHNILLQAGNSMLTHANQNPQGVLQLLS